jgi:CheY-like chemotaxis protein
MSFNVLIVEDQPLIALNLQDTVEELGHHTVGIASNMYQALLLSTGADIALVDVNLEDGPTGPIIGRTLADTDVSVLFMTSDPGAMRRAWSARRHPEASPRSRACRGNPICCRSAGWEHEHTAAEMLHRIFATRPVRFVAS